MRNTILATSLLFGLALCIVPTGAAAQVVPSDNGPAASPQPWIGEMDLLASEAAGPSPDWVSVVGLDFRGWSSGVKLLTLPHGAAMCQAGPVNAYATARLDIPHGRKITHFRLWGYDNNATSNMSATLWETCLPDTAAAPNPSLGFLASVESAGTPGAFTVVADLNPAPTVNAHVCTYWAAVKFDECSISPNLTIRKIHVEYKK